MHHLFDREALEQDTIAAHSLYIEAVARAERVRSEVERSTEGVIKRDLATARNERDMRFITLRDLLNVLGYVPRGLKASLPPDPTDEGHYPIEID